MAIGSCAFLLHYRVAAHLGLAGLRIAASWNLAFFEVV